ncbi:MAG TPA: hypothetical protein VII28_04075 [Puia sp.]
MLSIIKLEEVMRFLCLSICMVFLFACNQKEDQVTILEKQIDSLNKRIDSAYLPGLGEFMVSIQLHHSKLWFAGKSGNWELANFELGEIQEALDDINHYNRDRPEIKNLTMINSPMDSLKSDIIKKDPESFNRSYIFLTNTCNGCHQVTKHEFNKIKIPDLPPVTDQVFDKP